MNTGNHPTIKETFLNRIAHYRIVRKLGQGGMSIVYEAIDEKLKRPVAIKILHPFLAEAKEYRSRFFREAEAVARLAHPNIVQIYDVASSDAQNEQLYIVTELLVGETLRDFIKRINLLELPEVSAMIIWEVARALEHAHQKGIIHRDIKPENIMICRDGQIKLMDFGIASMGSDESLTQSGTLLGSLSHLSPEVIKGQKATEASDVFSLATVFFWLLTNELPFVGDSPHALLKSIVDAPHKKVQVLSPYISDDLADIVEVGMKKDKKNRFKSAHEMSEAIEKALTAMGITIDKKRLEAFFKDPLARFSSLKTELFRSMEKQRDKYRQEKNEQRALALCFRLDANIDSPLKPKTSRRKWIFAFASLLILVGGIFFGVKSKEEKTIPIVPLENSIAASEQFFVDEKLSEVSEEKLEPEPMIHEEVKEKIPPPIKQALRLQEVEIVVWPFATIAIDGKILARDVKSVRVKLDRGLHHLTFSHLYAATVEKTIRVHDIKDPIELNVALIKSKPAFLVVRADIDADVAIDGRYKGSTQKSVNRPIVIPIPDKTHSESKEVVVSKDGFLPFISETEFIAGQTKELSVKLVPVDKSDLKSIDDHVKSTIKRLYP